MLSSVSAQLPNVAFEVTREAMRNLIFISHANPEDNEFARWLGLQLTREGYLIWSDITKLIGGETFWDDIEEAVRSFTVKFIFVLSKVSNSRQGTLDELHLAKTVSKTNGFDDFIIPVLIDSLQFSEINVALHRVNAIDFHESWWHGFNRLLEKLKRENTPQNQDNSNSSVVSSWWKERVDGKEILIDKPENLASNWFPFTSLPEHIYVHSATSGKFSFTRGQEKLSYPVYPIRQTIVSFASPEDLELKDVKSTEIPTQNLLNGTINSSSIKPIEAQNAFVYLLRNAWMSFVTSLSLPLYGLSNRRYCAYFISSILDKKLQSFELDENLIGRRSLVGKDKGRIWHFGISTDFQIDPIPAIVIRPHVLFSDDGVTIWKSVTRLHRARRSACRDWWNPHWRDRIFASVYWLAKKQGHPEELIISLAKKAEVKISTKPITFESPIGYKENFIVTSEIVDEDILYEDLDSAEFDED